MDFRQLVDHRKGTQRKSIFWDEDIYRQELQCVFGRSWLFLAHESQIPNPGDFFCTYMAEDAVIVVRGQDHKVRAFLNTCSHRGNRVCFAESGNTKSFTCNYHGWCYGLDGSLVNIPLQREAYHDRIDRSRLGLRPVPKVESFAGFVFGCLDPDAPSLREYLGELAWYMEFFATRGMELLGPPLKSILHCNWKVPAENFACDVYHVGWTHVAALKLLDGPLSAAAGNTGLPPDPLGIQVSTRYGHGFGAIWESATTLHRGHAFDDYLKHHQKEISETLGEWRAKLYRAHWDTTIFPNCSFLYGTNTWKVWHPRGPHETEVWTWTLVEKEMPASLKRTIQKEAIRTFGTAGTFESDDGQNFYGCTFTGQGEAARKGNVTNQMGNGRGVPHPELPGLVADNNYSELSARGFYRFWSEIMSAANWLEIRANDASWPHKAAEGADGGSRPAEVDESRPLA